MKHMIVGNCNGCLIINIDNSSILLIKLQIYKYFSNPQSLINNNNSCYIYFTLAVNWATTSFWIPREITRTKTKQITWSAFHISQEPAQTARKKLNRCSLLTHPLWERYIICLPRFHITVVCIRSFITLILWLLKYRNLQSITRPTSTSILVRFHRTIVGIKLPWVQIKNTVLQTLWESKFFFSLPNHFTGLIPFPYRSNNFPFAFFCNISTSSRFYLLHNQLFRNFNTVMRIQPMIFHYWLSMIFYYRLPRLLPELINFTYSISSFNIRQTLH